MTMVSENRLELSEPINATDYWPARVRLLDANGVTLSDASVLGDPLDGCLMLGEVAAPECLLAYYFGKARRSIRIDLLDRVVDGWLETCWDGHCRSWWIELGPTW